MNNEEIIIPQSMQAVAGPKTSLYTGTANESPIYTQEIKGENETMHTEAKNSRFGTRAKKCGGVKVL